LIPHGSETTDEIITFHMELLCTNGNATYLSPSFLPKLIELGWSYVNKYFASNDHKSRVRGINRPWKNGEPLIIIP
jgi:hypothetical protein